MKELQEELQNTEVEATSACGGVTVTISGAQVPLSVSVTDELLGKGADVQAVDQDGLSAIMNAAENGSTAVVNYLINAGVSSQRLDAVGKGEAVPLVDEDTEEARATNRRVEFHVQGPSSR